MKRRRAAPSPTTMAILGICRCLPHELIFEILSRIPAKTLLRFKLVCKSWYNSIQDPVFIQMHFNRSMENDYTSVFLASEPSLSRSAGPLNLLSQIYSLECDSHDKCVEFQNPILHNSRVLGSCNGLICLSNGELMCLLNPVTREYKMLKVDKEISLTKSVFGLGYDGANDNYILVQLVDTDDAFDSDSDSNDDMDSQVYVYSLKDTLSCLKIANIPYRHLYASDLGVYLNGCLHWVATKKPYGPVDIVTFDNTEKVFQEMPQPVNLGEGADMTLGLLGGKLSILCDFYNKDTELWVMRKYGAVDSWIKIVSMVRGFLPSAPTSRVLCFSENGKLLLMDGNYPILYDPKTAKVWIIKYRGIRWYKICKSIVYLPNLISLKSGNYVDVVGGDQPSKKRKEAYDYNLQGGHHRFCQE